MARYLCFLVADLSLAIPVDQVSEVAPVPAITRVPRPTPHIEGLAILWGRAILVMDLRKRLGLVNPTIDQRTHMIVTNTGTGSGPMGFIVDSVGEILSVGEAATVASASVPWVAEGLLRNVIEVQGRRVFLPDLAKLGSQA